MLIWYLICFVAFFLFGCRSHWEPPLEIPCEIHSTDTLGSINVYFNKTVSHSYALPNNKANCLVNLENQLIHRILEAQYTLDLAIYELNLPKITNALIYKARQGVKVRVIVDAKPTLKGKNSSRNLTMRLLLEKMLRGADGKVGSLDDVALFADTPILAVSDPSLRKKWGLPINFDGLRYVEGSWGKQIFSGYLLVSGELKGNGRYYSPQPQMHNKFCVVDGKWVFTGSWNFTYSDLYGPKNFAHSNRLEGNQQHVVEIHSPELASTYTQEFNEMWGDTGSLPNPLLANFHNRKKENTPHFFNIGGVPLELYFSPGDQALERVRQLIKEEADTTILFSIFSWSDQAILNELKIKSEGSDLDLQGNKTSFQIKGIFDKSFWNQWWSASVDMSSRTLTPKGNSNPNTRWKFPAVVCKSISPWKIHSKTMLLDEGTQSHPIVITGSTNWSKNGNSLNDENMLIIHSAKISNQFRQEFEARWIEQNCPLE